MESTIHLNLSEDFYTLCTIYQIKPEYFVQKLIDQVSLPEYYSNPNENNRYGTLFFLQFIGQEEENCDVNDELEDHYLTTFNDAMHYNFDATPAATETCLSTGRNIMRQWLKAVLAERSKYLTDNL